MLVLRGEEVVDALPAHVLALLGVVLRHHFQHDGEPFVGRALVNQPAGRRGQVGRVASGDAEDVGLGGERRPWEGRRPGSGLRRRLLAFCRGFRRGGEVARRPEDSLATASGWRTSSTSDSDDEDGMRNTLRAGADVGVGRVMVKSVG